MQQRNLQQRNYLRTTFLPRMLLKTMVTQMILLQLLQKPVCRNTKALKLTTIILLCTLRTRTMTCRPLHMNFEPHQSSRSCVMVQGSSCLAGSRYYGFMRRMKLKNKVRTTRKASSGEATPTPHKGLHFHGNDMYSHLGGPKMY